jgi:hypothetical protein
MKNFFLENLNHLIIRDFWMVKIGHIFISPYKLQFLFVFIFFVPKTYFFESFTWGNIHMDFVVFLGIPNWKITLDSINVNVNVDLWGLLYRNPSFRLVTKVKACKVASWKEARGHISCFHECGKMWKSEPSHSQGNSHLGSWSPEGLLNL